MNLKNYAKYIVVDIDQRPMTFCERQFYHADDETHRLPLAIELYSEKTARELIKKSIKYRISQNFPIGEYLLMPIGKKLKQKP